MTTFEVFSAAQSPGLHIWKRPGNLDLFLRPHGRTAAGAWQYECDLDVAPLEPIYGQLFTWGAGDAKTTWEAPMHTRLLPRRADGSLPAVVYLFEGCARPLAADPFAAAHSEVTIHLITAARYRQARLYLWGPTVSGGARWVDQEPTPVDGYPVWRVALTDASRSAVLFKFFQPGANRWENDAANRLWVAADGPEIWTHSEGRDVLDVQPVPRTLEVSFRHELGDAYPATMHVWQEGADWSGDFPAAGAPQNGWSSHQVQLFTHLPYRFKFWNPDLPVDHWEHQDATRTIAIDGPTHVWTLEGDSQLFVAEPERTCTVELTVAAQPPGFELTEPHSVQLWVNRARGSLPTTPGLTFETYPEVTTSFRVLGGNGSEKVDRHYLRATPGATMQRYVVLGRPPVLNAPPPVDLVADPPFTIKRPGAYEQDDQLRFVVHAPWCAQVDVQGEWLGAGGSLPMRTTRDGTYWWAQVPVADVRNALGGDYHGRRYRFAINGDPTDTVQDPAAGWMTGTASGGWSRLVNSASYTWQSTGWQTPPLEYLVLYQLHATRFSSRGPAASVLDRVAWELTDAAGHLRNLDVTALQLMPVNEVGSNNSWGYDPAGYYAIEEDYGGPDALKRLVDACHMHDRAVLLDVIFNHAGTTDNILWQTAQGTFFDGDTEWGAMINYDDRIVLHFFEQNVRYLLEEFHVDGIRFDFTRVITRGNAWGEPFVRRPGSGGGWEFLQRMRAAMHAVNSRAVLIAEHLPNEWEIVNFGGSMDSEWCDDFHDRLKGVCSNRTYELGGLADALKLSHTRVDNWYKVTNYAESHDEVGNEPGRIADVAGLGRGLRIAKAAMTVTLLSRGLPMMFMGAEVGEVRQFRNDLADTLDLDAYANDLAPRRVRDWTNVLLTLRRDNPNLQGPSPIDVRFAQDGQLAFTRGQRGDYFVVVNFTDAPTRRNLSDMNLPEALYRELWNSSWPAFQVEWEVEHTNGGRDARLGRWTWLNVPNNGAIVLERVD